ncbi:MAG: SpoIIE family protein phosphatase [Lachnospiraceae bacterium]|nr:SpoIIE family protein phosphatase [Lachnospiraceae bacterium]
MKKRKKLGIRLGTWCFLFSLLLGGVIGVYGVTTHYQSSLQKYRDYIFTILKFNLLQINADEWIQNAHEGILSEAYQKMAKNYNALIDVCDLRYFYSIFTDQNGEYRYYLCGLPDEDQEADNRQYMFNEPVETEMEEDVFTLYGEIMSGERQSGYLVNSLGDQLILTGLIPIYGQNGKPVGILGADMDMWKVRRELFSYAEAMVGVFLLMEVLFLIPFCMMIHQKMVRPISRIQKRSTEFMQKVQKQESQIENGDWILRTEDEIEVLARGVSTMMRDMLSYIGSIETFSQMQRLAQTIQSSIMPDRIPAFPGRTEFDIYAVRHYVKPVGSVFYDYFMLDGVRLGVMAAKIRGDGVACALFMMMTRTLLKNYALLGMEPAKVLSSANDELSESNDAQITVSAVFGILDTCTGEFIYANAGEANLYRIATDSISLEKDKENTDSQSLGKENEDVQKGVKSDKDSQSRDIEKEDMRRAEKSDKDSQSRDIEKENMRRAEKSETDSQNVDNEKEDIRYEQIYEKDPQHRNQEKEDTQKAKIYEEDSRHIEKVKVAEGFLLGTLKGISFSQHLLQLTKKERLLLCLGVETEEMIQGDFGVSSTTEEREQLQEQINDTCEDSAIVVMSYFGR